MTAIARLFVSLIAGFVVVGLTMALFLRLFSQQQMEYMAFVPVGFGLLTLVLCWRSTRSWRPRRLTPAEMAGGFDVHLSKPFLTFLVVIGIITFGTFAVVFWMATRRWPSRIDPEGMTLRNGHRLAWQDVTEVTMLVKRIGGAAVNKSWRIRGGGVTAEVVPRSLAEGPSVREFLQAVLEARGISAATFSE
jgi:hypothetical protein